MDYRAALRKGARTFEEIAPGGLGYFGWPAAARAVTAERALRLRGRLMAREILRAFGKPPAAGARRDAPGRRQGRKNPRGPVEPRGSEFTGPGVRRQGDWLNAVWYSQKPGIRLPRHHPPRRSQITFSSSSV